MVAITLFIWAIAGLVFSKKFLGDYFSPPAVYSFFWAFALGTLELGWVAFDPMRSYVWSVILFSYLGFMAGCLAVTCYGLARPGFLSRPASFQFQSRARLEQALIMLFLLGVMGFLVQLAHLQSEIGLATFLSDPREAREMHSNIKYLGFFNVLNVSNFVLSLMYLALYKRPRKWVILIMLWALATTFLTTDRTRFFYMVIWSFYIVVYLRQRVNLSIKMVLAACATLFILLGFFVLVSKLYKKQAFEDNMEYVRVDREVAVLVDPYIYLTGSFPVLQAFLEDKRELTYGKYSMGPLVKLVELFYPEFEREELVGKFYRVPIELNACTYLEPFYKDFGFAGIMIGPFFLGLVCMGAYLAMRQRKTMFSVYFASLLSFCITISIFVNHFTQIATWYFALIGFVVYRYCRRNDPVEQDEYRRGIYLSTPESP